MSYELKKPYTNEERMNFIVRYNHQEGLRTEETDLYLFALEKNEIMGEKEVEGEIIPYPVIDPHWEQEQADKREADFKSKFFNIEGYGWYRKQPKGYSSAIESLNTAFNSFTIMQQTGIENFPANVFIFYQAPDFTKPEECTEEWLVAHQTKNEAMTALEFGTFYTTFANTWNAEEHE